MKKTALILGGFILAAQIASASSIGIGYGLSTDIYKGGDNSHVLPMFDFEYDNFFLKGATVNGISFGYNLYQDDFYTLSLYVKPFGGYKIDADDMDSGYKSIDDRKYKVMGGAEFTVYTGFYDVEMSASFDYGKEGGNFVFGVNRPYYVNSKLSIIPSVNFIYFTSDYVDYYFGVESHELGGKITRTYEGESAYAVGFNLAAAYRFTDSFSLLGFAGVERLSKEIKNSPIVDDNMFYFVGTGLIYTF